MTPDWRLTVPKRGLGPVRDTGEHYEVDGTGPPPTVADLRPPVVAPPPAPPPPEDDLVGPFQWPAEPSGLAYDPAERYASPGEGFYAGPPTNQNPLPGPEGTRFAGFIQAGTIGSWDLTGWRGWAPPGASPTKIRRFLRTGRLT